MKQVNGAERLGITPWRRVTDERVYVQRASATVKALPHSSVIVGRASASVNPALRARNATSVTAARRATCPTASRAESASTTGTRSSPG